MINSKQKGKSGERELCLILDKRFGEGKRIFFPTPSSGAWGGGQNRELREDMSWEQKITLVSDIMTPVDFKYVIEHKFYKNVSFYDLFNPSSNLNDWIDQVESDAAFVGKEPLLVVKTNNKPRFLFVKEKIFVPKFTYYRKDHHWHCYWLNDFLELSTDFFFEKLNV